MAVAVGALLLLLVALSALLSWQARQLPPPEVFLPRVGATEGGETAGAGTGEGLSEPDEGQPVAVHAAGAFARPGLYELPSGSRVADLMDAAGGPAADAVVDALNLAAKLSDGERIYMPRRGEQPVDVAVASGPAAGGAGASENAVIDLNTATLEQLDSLTGIGPSTAQAILDHRREHGRFRSVEELLEVRGIGEAKLASIRSRVRV